MQKWMIGVFCVFVVAGCSKRENGDNKTEPDTQSSALPAANAPAPSNADTTQTAAQRIAGVQASDTVPEDKRVTDGNIVESLMTADSLEVLTGKAGQKKATDPEVQQFAATLVADHQKGHDQMAALAKQLGIRPEPVKGDTAKLHQQHVSAKMQAAPTGTAFDTLYAHHGVRDHSHDIAETQGLMAQAQNPQLKSFIQDSVMPVLRKHLQSASALTLRLPH
jgi:putative membrane protein